MSQHVFLVKWVRSPQGMSMLFLSEFGQLRSSWRWIFKTEPKTTTGKTAIYRCNWTKKASNEPKDEQIMVKRGQQNQFCEDNALKKRNLFGLAQNNSLCLAFFAGQASLFFSMGLDSCLDSVGSWDKKSDVVLFRTGISSWEMVGQWGDPYISWFVIIPYIYITGDCISSPIYPKQI